MRNFPKIAITSHFAPLTFLKLMLPQKEHIYVIKITAVNDPFYSIFYLIELLCIYINQNVCKKLNLLFMISCTADRLQMYVQLIVNSHNFESSFGGVFYLRTPSKCFYDKNNTLL